MQLSESVCKTLAYFCAVDHLKTSYPVSLSIAYSACAPYSFVTIGYSVSNKCL